MSITQRLTSEAEIAGARYGLLVEAWRGIYHRALNDSRFGSAKLIAAVREQGYALARTYLDNEAVFIETAFAQIASDAHSDTTRALGVAVAPELTDDAETHLSAICEYLQSELSIQIERDIAFLIDTLRKTYLTIALSASSRRVSAKNALMEFRLGNAAELQFFFHDRRNQKWSSRKFVRSVWRHSLLAAYNEVALLTIADHAVDVAMVRHDDPSSQFHEMKIALYSGSAFPTYVEIRNEVFHPNANAIVVPLEPE